MALPLLHQTDMTIGTRIRVARKGRGWSQDVLAELIGVDQTTVSSWERGRTEPSRSDVVRIASRLGLPISELEELEARRPGDRTPLWIPLVSWVSAGSVSDIGHIDPATTEDQLAVSDLPPGEYCATAVLGDSMDRVSPEGSRVIFNLSDRRLVAGAPYIFSLRGETTYKFFQPHPVPRLEPFSTNPANKTIFLNERGWEVIGRVVRSYIDL